MDFFALTPTQRRRQRKHRALARRLWHGIKSGQRTGDTQTLNWIWTTLSQHHSRDPLLLWRVRTACKTTAAMDRQGWKCGVCRIMNRKKAEFCQTCGGHWHTCFEEDNSWSWSASNAMQSSPRPRSGSARRRSQRQSAKGTSKGKEKGDKGSKEKGKPAPSQEGKAVSPFSVVGSYSQQQPSTAPWPVMDFSQFQTATSTSTTVVNQGQTSQPAQELIQAIKKAFPEASAMPAPVKEALEKAEVSGAKQITKDLHAATSALGRARRAFQEASEARKQLKSGWMKHLEESLAAWEKQLDTYRTSYAQLQDAESKALQDVANAKRSIQQLNSQSGSSGAEDQALVEEAVDLNGDKEEEKAKQRLQAVMQSCMVSVGVEMRQPEIMEIHSDTDVAPSKRQRSADPTLPKPTTS